MGTAANDGILIDVGQIHTDCQTRARLRPGTISEFKNEMRQGTEFDPLVVFDDDKELHLASGHHRLEAHKRAKRGSKIRCVVKKGTRWDAIKYGIADNLKHRGERPNRADKRHNVELVLQEGSEMSDRAIAEMCGVSATFVGKVSKKVDCQRGQSTGRVGRDGRRINTAGIGRKQGSNAGSKTSIPPSLEDRLKTLGKEARIDYERFRDIRLRRGEPEGTASWRALVDVRQKLGQLKAENLLQADQEASPDSAPCVEENCATADTEQSIGMFQQMDELLVKSIALAKDLAAIQKAGCTNFANAVDRTRRELRAWRETREDAGERAAGWIRSA